MDIIKRKIESTLEKLNSFRVVSSQQLECFYVDCPEYKVGNVPPKDGWKPLEKGRYFGDIDKHWWIRLELPEFTPEENFEYRLAVRTGKEGEWDSCNPQCTVLIDGKTVQALDTNHNDLPIVKGGEVYIYLYNGMEPAEFYFKVFLEKVDLKTEALYFDINVPYLSMLELDEKSYDYIKIRDSLDKATLLLDIRKPHSNEYYASVLNSSKYLEEEFYGKICGDTEAVISCIGHTHIDVAWLWTLAQTREKAQRSFSTVLNLMKKYDKYIFMSSQPQLYQFVKEDDPELYAEIKERIAEGRWECEGAMWLEADTNLISGESLIRQIMYGKRFMKEEFGIDSKILWLPDVFGYSGALPQILKKCGVDKFFTAKMCWNENNPMPNDVFMWQGIDSSEVFALLIPGYVNNLTPNTIKSLWNSFKNKSVSNNPIVTFGWGDGGGGPTKEMLENCKRLEKGIPGMPKTKIETATAYMERLEKDFIETSAELRYTPRWKGEMYFERHRGTYTTVAKNKKNNRKSELLYQKAETLAACNTMLGGEYPTEKFRKNQTTILLNHFHDVIPGSSIKEVYDVSDAQYKQILKEGKECADEALKGIMSSINTKGGIMVYNPTPFEVSDVVELKGKKYYAEGVPSHGWKVIEPVELESKIKVTSHSVENDLIKYTFDDNYHIISIFDKVLGKEVVAPGCKANVLEAYEDLPYDFDAWEISSYYKQKKWIIDDVSEVTPLENGIRVKRKYQNSEFIQDMILNKNSKRLDFVTTLNWQERHQLIKTAFPVDVHNTNATYEIQFGNVQRPTHHNTSWDEAMFEVCAHKWADLSEHGYGVSLLNDCKYGYNTEGNVIKLTLIKGSTYPNPEADMGMNEFTYSIYPHEGDWRDGKTIEQAYSLNMPLEAYEIKENKGVLEDRYSFISCLTDGVVLETIKKAEDGSDIIARFYEAFDGKKLAEIATGFDFKEVYLCDMLENNIQKLEFTGRKVEVPVKNFEIVTIKFVL